MENIFFQYLSWQFFEAPKGILKGWKNFLLFNLNYFSVPLLISSLFAPWKGIGWSYPRGFDIGLYFEAWSSNLISRGIGAVCRIFLIIMGLLIEIPIFFIGVIIFIGWLILPILLILGIYHGFRILL